jgi:hypothetical protein
MFTFINYRSTSYLFHIFLIQISHSQTYLLKLPQSHIQTTQVWHSQKQHKKERITSSRWPTPDRNDGLQPAVRRPPPPDWLPAAPATRVTPAPSDLHRTRDGSLLPGGGMCRSHSWQPVPHSRLATRDGSLHLAAMAASSFPVACLHSRRCLLRLHLWSAPRLLYADGLRHTSRALPALPTCRRDRSRERVRE